MLKWIITETLLAGLYFTVIGLGDHNAKDAALVITGFAGLYGLFMLSFVLHDRN